ncbi:hypothetical protein J2I47_04740 [Fibrella sp. HMF5335]|uniref:Lipocalin-like domain-containing protein n=1 Tax=Fibrella rubiginis TaxID=2817060 RepID=A0A939GB88_9BACT|nr:hypothetical protein [Fibrella rubiginis]MBO0935847.1 hypothetical protein [Fibrella rubiginis]
MKTSIITRRLAIGLLAMSLFSACKKDADVTPTPTGDLGTRAAGQYTLTEVATGGKTYPAAQADLKGTISITRATETTANIDFNIRSKSDNGEVLVGNVNGLQLSASGSAIAFKGDNAQVATLNGNKLSVEISDNSGVAATFIATK